MSQSKNNLNEEWRKVFEEASETPPPNIWNAIEKTLDEEKNTPAILPWWKKPQAWAAAASILLMLGIGSLLILQKEDTPYSNEQLSAQETQPTSESIRQQNDNTPDLTKKEDLFASSAPVQKPNAQKSDPQVLREGSPAQITPPNQAQSEQFETQLQGDEVIAQTPVLTDVRASKAASATPVSDKTNESAAPLITAGNNESEVASEIALATLEPLPFEEIKTYWQTRYVFFNPSAGSAAEQQPVDKPSSGSLWAGVSMMPGGFNPHMKLTHQNVYQMNNALGGSNMYPNVETAFNSSNRAVTGNRDQPKISFQTSAQMGLNLTKNWSLESGISYLQGNSTSRSPGYYLNNGSRESADLLANALMAGRNAQYSSETVDKLQLHSTESSTMAVYVPRDQNMNNSYSFLQVPAYIGYTFRPDKKFSYAILGGGIANLFLQNKLETASGYTLKTSRENNVYKNVGIAGATGVRVSYRVNSAWHTNLTANYQQSLTTSFKDNLFLKAYPRVYGISWGVRYTFQR